MKIAIITSGFLPVVDGVTVSGMYRLERLSRWGHQVLLFCPDYSSLESVYPNWRDYSGEILPNVRVVNLPSTPFMDLDFERNVGVKANPILRRELEAFQPDIIHVDEPERLFFGLFRIPGVKYARQHNIPCICFFRTNFLDYAEDYFPLPGWAIALIQFIIGSIFIWIYNAYDVTLVSSKVTHPKLIEMGIKNTQYVNLLGFDADKFSPDLREEGFWEKHYGLPEVDRRVKLIFLGRLTPDKGWEFTFKSLPALSQAIDLDKVAFLVAGDGSIRDEIADRVGKFTPHIHLLGRVSPEDIPALLANSDIHVTTSEKETRGLTVLEAFGSGIPVLAPNSGGVVENIENGKNGFIYTPQDSEDFTQKLKQL
ncbi:MAG TPA: glycosyltransferase, partial [Oscillatoriales cyanobacterium M59_W2019_021]|nr:glycosyltransferase [Oscillatoriales cyanobacterium M59_W2019_021]